MNIVLGIDDFDPKLQIRANLVLKLKCAPIFMKFGTQDISDMLIINTLRLMDGLDPKEEILENLVQT